MATNIKVKLKNVLLSLSEVTDIANQFITLHQQRTCYIAMEIARFGMANRQITQAIFIAALLHDIGAISVEEKMALRVFETNSSEEHCRRGAILLQKIPCFTQTAQIIRHHHTSWNKLQGSLTDPLVFAAQVIQLADLVERLVDRKQYILHQNQAIIAKVQKVNGNVIHRRIINYFLEAAKREEFWFNLVSPHLTYHLLATDISDVADAGIDALALIAELFREIIDFKSPFTAAHSSGVSACAGKLANLYGFTATDCELMKIAGNLHDIGKMAIPNAILEKSGKLTPAEFAIVKSHTYYTYHVLKPLAPISQIAEWAAYHHEKLDGSGYPFHRHSGELDFGSRIMAVADIYTAIAEERPYRSGMSHNQIYQVLKNAAVHQYIDSEIVALLLDNYHIVSEHVRERQTTARSFYHNSFCRPEDPGRNS